MDPLKGKKILVALSGGVDSSVAAALLVRAGYDVTAAYMVNFDSSQESVYGETDLGLACWRKDYQDALRVAAHLQIPLRKLDYTREYSDFVLRHMFAEYEKGRTPNPDVLCNRYIKFDAWLKDAQAHGFDYLATGHYAGIERGADEVRLVAARDKEKDQTYFLHQLSQDQLRHTLFPLQHHTKSEVREMARSFGLPTAQKAESMGVCFVGEVPMVTFLETRIAHTPGPIVLRGTGEVIGQHKGLPFYTIGQRHGFSQPGGGEPLYVLVKDHKKNQLIVGVDSDPARRSTSLTIEQIHWISGHPPEFPLDCEVRLRHRQELQQAVVRVEEAGIAAKLAQPQEAVTPGQFAVFYHRSTCLGGGVVAATEHTLS